MFVFVLDSIFISGGEYFHRLLEQGAKHSGNVKRRLFGDGFPQLRMGFQSCMPPLFFHLEFPYVDGPNSK